MALCNWIKGVSCDNKIYAYICRVLRYRSTHYFSLIPNLAADFSSFYTVYRINFGTIVK